jgi:MFS family permease
MDSNDERISAYLLRERDALRGCPVGRLIADPEIAADERLREPVRQTFAVLHAYTLVFAALLLSAGRVGDRIGARRSYLTGLAVFGAASVVCSLVGHAALLIPARALQGV